MSEKFAVLVEHGGAWRLANFDTFVEWHRHPTAADIFEFMIEENIYGVWVAPGGFRVLTDDVNHFLTASSDWDFKMYDDEEFLTSLHAYKKVGAYGSPARQMRSIIWPEFSGWHWSAEEAPAAALMISVPQLDEIVNGCLSSSPAATGRKLYTELLKRTNHVTWLALQGLARERDSYPWDQVGKDCIWKREFDRILTMEDLRRSLLDISEGAPLYIHAIDKNSSYLSGSQSLSIGIGEPAFFDSHNDDWGQALFDSKPGLWHIQAQRPLLNPYDGVLGPSPLYSSAYEEGGVQEWVTTPLLALLKKQGWSIRVLAGIYWPDNRRIFEDFAPQLWKMRQHFRRLHEASPESAHFALDYNAMKQIIVSFFGLFGSEKNRDPRTTRRDIWAAVVEQAKCMMFYNIDKIFQEVGAWPVGVYTDCLIYVSQEADARQAIGSIMERPGELGGYKLKWSLPVDAEVLAALGQGQPAEMLAELNELAARQQEEAVN